MSKTTTRRLRLGAIAIAATATLMLVTGCAAGAGTAADSTSAGPASIDIDSAQVITDSFAGLITEAPSDGPAAQTDKEIWVINCQAYPVCVREVDALIEAGSLMGWDVKVSDHKFDPNTALSTMRQAISAGADAIWPLALDCSAIKSGIEEANAAGIPVFSINEDCGTGEEALFAAPFIFGGTASYTELFANAGRKNAEFVLAQAKEQGITNPIMLQARATDASSEVAANDAFTARVNELCEGCQIIPLDYTFAQMAEGKGPAIFKAGVLAHPQANILIYDYSAVLDQGLSSAIATRADNPFEITCCGNAEQIGIKYLIDQAGVADTMFEAANAPFEWYGWAMADTMNRYFAGEDPAEFPNQGGSIFYIDEEHNLPASAEDWPESPYDFKAAYEKVWLGR
jgi:ribose transport system substrate-binding protein